VPGAIFVCEMCVKTHLRAAIFSNIFRGLYYEPPKLPLAVRSGVLPLAPRSQTLLGPPNFWTTVTPIVFIENWWRRWHGCRLDWGIYSHTPYYHLCHLSCSVIESSKQLSRLDAVSRMFFNVSARSRNPIIYCQNPNGVNLLDRHLGFWDHNVSPQSWENAVFDWLRLKTSLPRSWQSRKKSRLHQ
jgi:hypothetical protein